MTALDILLGARVFLSDPAHWRQKGFATYDETKPDENIVCTACLDGALYHSAGIQPGSDIIPAPLQVPFTLARLLVSNAIAYSRWPAHNIWDFNDDKQRKHSEILDVLDRAIEAEEAAQ